RDKGGVTHIAAKVVDPVAVKKVEEGVYQGFSIGGKVTKRSGDDSKTIEGLKLIEISLVDRPANPEALLELYKADADDKAVAAESTKKAPEPVPAAKAAEITKTETPVPAPAAAPPAKNDQPKPGSTTVAKSMRHVQWAAELCDQIASLAKDTQYEADFEGDGSPIPGRIRGLTREMGG